MKGYWFIWTEFIDDYGELALLIFGLKEGGA